VHEGRFRDRGRERLIRYGHDLSVARTPEPWLAKFLGLWARVTGAPHGGSLVALGVEVTEKPEQAREILRSFLRDNPAFARDGYFSDRLPAG
jgi:hypothetical protein